MSIRWSWRNDDVAKLIGSAEKCPLRQASFAAYCVQKIVELLLALWCIERAHNLFHPQFENKLPNPYVGEDEQKRKSQAKSYSSDSE